MRNMKNIPMAMHLKRDIEYQSINGLNQMIKNVFRSQITKIMKRDVVTLNPRALNAVAIED